MCGMYLSLVLRKDLSKVIKNALDYIATTNSKLLDCTIFDLPEEKNEMKELINEISTIQSLGPEGRAALEILVDDNVNSVKPLHEVMSEEVKVKYEIELCKFKALCFSTKADLDFLRSRFSALSSEHSRLGARYLKLVSENIENRKLVKFYKNETKQCMEKIDRINKNIKGNENIPLKKRPFDKGESMYLRKGFPSDAIDILKSTLFEQVEYVFGNNSKEKIVIQVLIEGNLNELVSFDYSESSNIDGFLVSTYSFSDFDRFKKNVNTLINQASKDTSIGKKRMVTFKIAFESNVCKLYCSEDCEQPRRSKRKKL